MSSGLMDTEKGGEQTQYESEHNDVLPPKRSGGQLGQPSTDLNSSKSEASSERGAQTAENIRYGQAISEQGVGGFTNSSTGEATKEGYGRQEDQVGEETSDAAGGRKAAGYGGEKDMDREIGA